MSNVSRTADAFLTCGCIRHYSPAPVCEDQVYCPWHDRYVTVLGVATEYRVRCEDCRYGRGYGAGKLTAQRSADAHQRKYPTHTVLVLRGITELERRNGLRVDYVTPLALGLSDEAPF